jgi:hypothetical protein
MHLVGNNIRWIMLAAGALTCTMVYAAVAPQAALLSMFGETLEGPLAEIVVRNWGALIALQGVLLIWGAFDLQVRSTALAVGIACKVLFVALVLAYGSHYLGRQPAITFAIASDLVWVVLFSRYLLGARTARA